MSSTAPPAEPTDSAPAAVPPSERPPLYVRGTFRDRASRRGHDLFVRSDDDDHKTTTLPSTLLGISQAALFASKLSSARLAIGKKKLEQISERSNTVHKRNVGKYTVIAFLNTGSGGGEATAVQSSFRDLLGAEFVYDLDHCAPEDILLGYALDPMVRVLACGGDGTMGWVEGATDTVWDDLLDGTTPLQDTEYAHHLPLAIMPLGTGNDLSRTLGWGSEYKPYMKTPLMLQRVIDADIVQLDRWRCVIVPEDQVDDETKESIPVMLSHRVKRATSEAVLGAATAASTPPTFLSTAAKTTVQAAEGGECAIFDGVFCNYFGIGIEADIALAFHQERAKHPENFTSPFVNKLVYLRKGLSHMNGPVLRDRVRIVVSRAGSDYTELIVPKNCRSIIFLNIDSYAAGTKLAKGFHHDDKLIEVIFCPGINRLGLARAGMKIKPAASVDRILIKTIDDVPCQVDGEPWSQPPSMISIRLECQRPVLKAPSTRASLSCRCSPA